jgi:hypothetical protein
MSSAFREINTYIIPDKLDFFHDAGGKDCNYKHSSLREDDNTSHSVFKDCSHFSSLAQCNIISDQTDATGSRLLHPNLCL